MLRDQAGRVIYVGRSRDLAGRVRSYWIDLKDRPHLAPMVARASWVEPVLCSSEHEAAFLESDLLERHPTRYNRTLGMESCVWLRLDAGAKSPGLDVEHEARPDDGAEWFGPYLGWEPTRQAAAGLLKLYPLRYAGDELGRTERELARSLGVSTVDRLVLAGHIRRVLRREPDAVRGTISRLEQTRDSAAEALMFESAAAAQGQIRADCTGSARLRTSRGSYRPRATSPPSRAGTAPRSASCSRSEAAGSPSAMSSSLPN